MTRHARSYSTTPSALAALSNRYRLTPLRVAKFWKFGNGAPIPIPFMTALDAPLRKGAQDLREVQAERKVQEAREQEAIYEVGMCHLVAGKEFSPAEFGFVCSKAEAESLVKRKWTLEHASNAHTWNFDRESCVPALAFAA